MTIPQILNFWFGQIREEPAYLKERFAYWFGKSDEQDRKIRELFEKTWEAAMAGDCNPWADNPRGRLALVLVLDQFPRNMFRDTPKAFAGDPKARELCLGGLALAHDRQLHPIERVFLYMPLQHAEDLALQRKSMECFERLAREAPPALRSTLEENFDYAVKHFEIIERFGRFPHRNEILGRPSTEEELEFLQGPNSSF